eukprot:scaffold52352_cov36-Phaeocystis_antarctica.AAC.1
MRVRARLMGQGGTRTRGRVCLGLYLLRLTMAILTTAILTTYSRSSMPRTMNWPMLADDMNMTITVEVAEETCMCTWRGMCMRVHGASIAWT